MSEKKSTIKVIVFVLILAACACLLCPSAIALFPEQMGTAIKKFMDYYFLKTILSKVSLEAIVAAVITMVISWMIATIVKYIADRTHYKQKRSEALRHLIEKILIYSIYIAGVIIALGCLGVDTAAIFVSAGVIGVIVGFGAQSLIEDVITGLSIILENEFEIGDIITIDGFRGEVKSIGFRTVSIIDVGGNIRIINNRKISSLINLSEVTSVAVVKVPISYKDPLEKTEAAIQEALSELSVEYPDIFKKVPVYEGVDKLTESHMELMVVANVSEENIYKARRIMQRKIRYSCEKAQLSSPCGE